MSIIAELAVLLETAFAQGHGNHDDGGEHRLLSDSNYTDHHGDDDNELPSYMSLKSATVIMFIVYSWMAMQM